MNIDPLLKVGNPLFYYSEYWRCNKSALEPRELANVLRALRKVGAYIATNIKPIEWAGAPGSPEEKILLDISLVLGKYPVPAWKMDFLVGMVVREAYRCRELSDMVVVHLKPAMEAMKSGHSALMGRMADIGEDIYVRQAACGAVWENYLIKIWNSCRRKETRDLFLPPTARCLFQIWEEFCLEGRIQGVHHDYLQPLEILLSHTRAIGESAGLRSILKRSKVRSEIYLSMWQEVVRFIDGWEDERPLENNGAEMLDERGVKKFSEMLEDIPDENPDDVDERKPLPGEGESNLDKLVQDVNKETEETEENGIDGKVRMAYGNDTGSMMETVFVNASLPCRIPRDPLLVQRLKSAFELQRWGKPEHFRNNRGLPYGKIDGRRLYRAALDGKIFRQKEFTKDSNAWNITILVDASASMKGEAGNIGKDWAITQRTFVSLCEAARGSGNTLNVFAYYEIGGRCQISRLYHGNRLYSVTPQGHTPTGQAIVAAVLKTPKDKRRMIVHITDGEPNCGAGVEQALEFCSREGVELVTIGSYNDVEEVKALFQEQYGDRVYLMESLEHLPEGLESLLRRKLLDRGH
ncbi:MAG: hypothetical protein VR68_04585 [Peptococcaceae bacterium BRH_c4a]|nr:MAG: hypothetical protein VR68_04585 [Peptococcaceae bacterium BRH_c4a]